MCDTKTRVVPVLFAGNGVQVWERMVGLWGYAEGRPFDESIYPSEGATYTYKELERDAAGSQWSGARGC